MSSPPGAGGAYQEDGLLSLGEAGVATEAAVPEDGELGKLRTCGKDLVNYFFMSLRTLSIHEPENLAVQQPLSRLRDVLVELSTLVNVVHFIAVEGQVYLNDLRIRMEAAAYDNVRYLVGIMDRHGIGGISFDRPLAADDLRDLVLLLLKHKPDKEQEEEPLASIRDALRRADIPGVNFDQPYFYKAADSDVGLEQGESRGDQETAALAYSKGVLAVKDYFRAVEAAEAANPLRIRKIVHDLVDVADAKPEDFLRLHTIHGVEDPYYNHCVNVASLAVAIGRHLGLTKVEMAELGSSSMFHDVGYAALEREALESGRELSDDERMKEHTIAGFKALLRQGEYSLSLLRRLLVTLEHHMHFKRPGGFPNLGGKRLSVYTRILQVADHYDALVTASGDSPGLLPVKALERIVASAGTVFDPLVVKALIHVVGRYPYGSLVKLSTGEMGVVTCGGRDAASFSKPTVMIVRNADGTECDPREVDLRERDTLRRRIVEVLDPFSEGVTPHAILFDELGEEDEEEEHEFGTADPGQSVDAWTEAVWSGEDPMAATGSQLETVTGEQAGSGASSTSEPAASASGHQDEAGQDEPAASISLGPVAPSWMEDMDDDEPQPWETAEPPAPEVLSQSSEAVSASEGEGELPDEQQFTPEEIARKKAAWQEALAKAFAEGGEEAVAKLAATPWQKF
ncbi:MAG TPA: hypothetical protein DIU15_12270 [Deltaproteobacteria bacterium]|nr:hypothetical protein [Deltaproteobacteria bacterium]HCP46812.1 hypothetical protein [Deltaproteobacteria bacterium]